MKKTNAVLLSTPYILWMVVFTLIPLGVVCFYALTDAAGNFTLANLMGLGAYLPVLWQSIVYSLAAAMICLLLVPQLEKFCKTKAERLAAKAK